METATLPIPRYSPDSDADTDLLSLEAEERLVVTHVSTTDLRGGAARAAHRLHRALPAMNVHSQMLVAQRFGTPGADVFEFNPFSRAPAIIGRALFRLGRRWHRPPIHKAGRYFSPDWSFMGRRLLRNLPQSDVINLHWVADLLDYRTLPEMAQRVPIVWTLHDMNAFTGGCHYSEGCERFTRQCGACPLLATSRGEMDMTRRVLLRKQRSLARVARDRLVGVCPSSWLASEARRSTLFRKFDVRVIPNGIDLQEYRPIGGEEARRQLNLPLDARIVLFVAESIEDRRKGFRLLLKALEAIRDIPHLLLVTIGAGANVVPGGMNAQHLGALHQPGQLRAAYSAADVFAIPSRQDNLPNTVLESMACRTPVVGFSTGGVGEAVVDGETGFLAPLEDARGFAQGLRRILEDPELRNALAANARRRAECEYDVELQARRYAALYRELQPQRAAEPGWENEPSR